jgi:hypothetical protein
VPLQALIDHIEGDSTFNDFLQGFPSVAREHAIRFIELASRVRILVDERVLVFV